MYVCFKFCFFLWLVLTLIIFGFTLRKYRSKNYNLKLKSKLNVITFLVYSIGNSLFLFGVVWLIGIISLYFSGIKVEPFEVYTLLATTTITSTGLSISLDRVYENVKIIDELSTEIGAKIFTEVSEQLSDDVKEVTNKVIK